MPGVTVFHPGTMLEKEAVLANGGRVLAVNATGDDLRQAIERAYVAVDRIEWQDGFCRRDIGIRALHAAV